jgi:uncharacterized protein DUF6166
MKTYCGKRGGTVSVDERPLPLRLDLANHSPTGFAWGYGGSGPAQLALAMLADCFGDELALQWYQPFKFRVIAGLPDDWSLSEQQVRDVIADLDACFEESDCEELT